MIENEFVEEFNKFFDLVKKDQLDQGALVFFVASKIVKEKKATFIDLVPNDVRNGVKGMIDTYKKNGELVAVSNIGVKDHSEMANELVELLEGKL